MRVKSIMADVSECSFAISGLHTIDWLAHAPQLYAMFSEALILPSTTHLSARLTACKAGDTDCFTYKALKKPAGCAMYVSALKPLQHLHYTLCFLHHVIQRHIIQSRQ